MPEYTTPTAIDLAIDLQVGWIDIVASDRGDTVVTVSPSSPSKSADRRDAEQTAVDFDGQRVTVVGPRPRFSWIGPTGSVDVRVEVPTSSRLTAEIAVGSLRATGTLGATRVKSAMGSVDLEATGDLSVRGSHGSVTVGAAEGDADVTADHGQIRVATIAGDAVLKSAHGSIRIDRAGGDVEAKLSYGDLEIARALGSVTGKTAYGSLRIAEVSSGSIQLESGFGDITVAVRAGVPAWLDLSSASGHVRNQLESEPAPADSEQSVSVRGRAQHGDITIERAR